MNQTNRTAAAEALGLQPPYSPAEGQRIDELLRYMDSEKIVSAKAAVRQMRRQGGTGEDFEAATAPGSASPTTAGSLAQDQQAAIFLNGAVSRAHEMAVYNQGGQLFDQAYEGYMRGVEPSDPVMAQLVKAASQSKPAVIGGHQYRTSERGLQLKPLGQIDPTTLDLAGLTTSPNFAALQGKPRERALKGAA